MNEQHVGSDFDDFLREDGLLEVAEAATAKRVLAYLATEPSARLQCPTDAPESPGNRSQT